MLRYIPIKWGNAMNDIARQSIIEISITKIGSIIESDDKFICKVEQENVRWIREL